MSSSEVVWVRRNTDNENTENKNTDSLNAYYYTCTTRILPSQNSNSSHLMICSVWWTKEIKVKTFKNGRTFILQSHRLFSLMTNNGQLVVCSHLAVDAIQRGQPIWLRKLAPHLCFYCVECPLSDPYLLAVMGEKRVCISKYIVWGFLKKYLKLLRIWRMDLFHFIFSRT